MFNLLQFTTKIFCTASGLLLGFSFGYLLLQPENSDREREIQGSSQEIKHEQDDQPELVPTSKRVACVGVLDAIIFPKMNQESSELKILNWICESRQRLFICVYYITHTIILEYLEMLKKTWPNIDIRIVTQDPNCDYTDSRQKRYDILRRLSKLGIKVKLIGSFDRKMHHKFAIKDDLQLLMGSANWTQAGLTRNFESLLIISSVEQVNIFIREFHYLWTQAKDLSVMHRCVSFCL